MSLILRVSPSEGCMRSVGDRPGVVGVGINEDGPLVFSSPNYHPSPAVAAEAARRRRAGKGGMVTDPISTETVQPFTVEEAVDALEDADACMGLLQMLQASSRYTATVASANLDFEAIERFARFCIEVRDGIGRRLESM